MTDARKLTIMQLINIRREIEDCIAKLCTNHELRQFAQRHEHGMQVQVREVRDYDVPAPDAEELIERYKVPDRPPLPKRTPTD